MVRILDDKSYRLPSPTQMGHARFIVDCVYMWDMRRRHTGLLASTDIAQAIYLLTDSSPQGHENWIMVESYVIDGDQLLKVLAASWRLHQ